MRRVIYSMGVSLDGYIAGRDRTVDWSAPDKELHRFHNEQTRATRRAPVRPRALRDDDVLGASSATRG